MKYAGYDNVMSMSRQHGGSATPGAAAPKKSDVSTSWERMKYAGYENVIKKAESVDGGGEVKNRVSAFDRPAQDPPPHVKSETNDSHQQQNKTKHLSPKNAGIEVGVDDCGEVVVQVDEPEETIATYDNIVDDEDLDYDDEVEVVISNTEINDVSDKEMKAHIEVGTESILDDQQEDITISDVDLNIEDEVEPEQKEVVDETKDIDCELDLHEGLTTHNVISDVDEETPVNVAKINVKSETEHETSENSEADMEIKDNDCDLDVHVEHTTHEVISVVDEDTRVNVVKEHIWIPMMWM